jgi:hypothetical protein
MAEFPEQPTSWKIIMEPMTGNVATSEVRALMRFVLRTVEKHMPYGKMVCATKCMML